MSLRTKTKERLYQIHRYRLGRVEQNALQGFIRTCEKVQGAGIKIPDLQITSLSELTTVQAIDATGVGRLYAIWALSAATADVDTIVRVTDNDIVIGSVKVKAAINGVPRATEVYFYGSDEGVGVEYATDLEATAMLASDGSTAATAGDRPDVIVIWGDSAINTDDANLAVADFG